MAKVKVFGAGSIGCHLTHASRGLGWEVDMLDIDPEALERTKNDVYPTRYGSWDDGIRLFECKDSPKDAYDVTIIGTPPDSHMKIAVEELKNNPPKVLLIEKPLCTPSLESCVELWELAKSTGTKVLVGYNHNLTAHSQAAKEILKTGFLGDAISISAYVREHWGGIFAAHPWLDGPKASYLGFWKRGGGATGEHSHSISAWQMFAHYFGKGKVTEVNATMQMVTNSEVDYDSMAFMQLTTEKGFLGSVTQDVITKPTNKSLRIQGSEGFLEWCVNVDANNDGLRYGSNSMETKLDKFPKTRPDDFKGEMQHVADLLSDKASIEDSPISLERGLDTMMVVSAAYKSAHEKRTVAIDYSAGYTTDALSLV